MAVKYFVCLVLSMWVSVVNADSLDRYILSLKEQDKAAVWVYEVTDEKVKQEKARVIVSDSYAHGISKGINPEIILAMMKVESNFKSNARSIVGAVGLMQVWPKWHKDKLKGRNASLDKVSTEVGTSVLKDCLDKHKQNMYKSLNCYSGGGGQKYYKKVMKYNLDLKLSMRSKDIMVASNVNKQKETK